MNAEADTRQLAQIVFPENTLIVLCGIAGCGKSTFAGKHFLPTQIVSSDDCRALICDDASNQRVTGHAFELWRFIIRKRLQIGRLTVADATNLESGDRKWLIKTAHYYNFLVSVIAFDLALETSLARNAARTRVVPEAALLHQYELLQATLRTLHSEGFNDVFVLDEAKQSQIEIHLEHKAEEP
jgi:protein phosphatase